jgi:DNA-binding MarR family transcriptional regulator
MATSSQDVPADELASIERALEQLLRLYSSRKVHARRSAAAGVMITRQGYLLLRRLQEDGALPMGELARITQMDPAAAGRQVRQLEEDGLVTRTKGEDDGRVVVVEVTPRGAAVRQRLSTVGEDHMSDVLADWPAEDREQLALLLPRFVEGLRSVPFRSSLDELAS